MHGEDIHKRSGTHMDPVFHISSSTTSSAACTKNWFCWFCAESSLCRDEERRLRCVLRTNAWPCAAVRVQTRLGMGFGGGDCGGGGKRRDGRKEGTLGELTNSYSGLSCFPTMVKVKEDMSRVAALPHRLATGSPLSPSSKLVFPPLLQCAGRERGEER